MSKIRKYMLFTIFMVFGIMFVNVGQVGAVPSTGGITCTYTLPYQSSSNKKETAELKISIKDGAIVTNDSWTCSNPSNSPCLYINDQTGIMSYTNNLKNIASFYSESKKTWACPNISYSLWFTFLGSPDWILAVGPVKDKFGDLNPNDEIGKSNSLKGTASNVVNTIEPEETEKETLYCAYKAKDIEYGLELEKESLNAKVTINGQYVHDLQLSSYVCPLESRLRYCKYAYNSNSDYSKDRIVVDKTCAEWALENGESTDFYENYNSEKGETTTTDADGNEVEKSGPSGTPLKKTDFGEDVSGCSVLSDIKDHIQTVFDWLKIIAPILLILFGALDFGKAVVQNDNDALKKATNNFIKRAIATVAIFFLPLLINLVLKLPGVESGLNDALCGIGKVVIK